MTIQRKVIPLQRYSAQKRRNDISYYRKIFSAAYCSSMMVLASTMRPSPIMASA
jgi:hypothetical protein